MYICVRIVTGSKLAAFFTALLFNLSYIGKYDMYSSGGYHYFLQRGVILLPQLFAFTLFILYFRKFSFKFYFLSLGIYFLGILMGFFGAFFLPLFIFYPFVYFIPSLRKIKLRNIKKNFFKIFWTPFLFLAVTILVIKHSKFYSYPGEEPFLSFLSHFSNNFSGLIHQIAVVTLPIGGYKWLLDNLHWAMELEINLLLGIFLIIIYLWALLFIWKSHPNWSVFAATSFASLIAMLLFNLYKNSATVLASLESSRYFYFPFSMLAVFWGIFLASLFSSPKIVNKFLVVVFCLVWILHNNSAIQKAIKIDEWRHSANKTTIEYLQLWSKDLKENPSYVFLPANLGAYGAAFAFRYFSHRDGHFKLESLDPPDFGALVKRGVDPNRLYILHFDPGSQVVVDKTKEARKMLYQLQKGYGR